MEDYVILRRLGSGSFGSVFLARHTPSSSLVALKKILIKRPQDGLPRVVLREIQALSKLSGAGGEDDDGENDDGDNEGSSKYLLPLLTHFCVGSSIILVLPYMQTDLYQIMQSIHTTVGRRTGVRECKTIMWMAMKGLASIHSHHILHRDIKPSNLLFSSNGCLKIGDFGLARVHTALNNANTTKNDPTYSHEVATRWYRSPELLYGARKYDSAVDIWSIGAIFYELLSGGTILFPGINDIDQLYRVLRVVGTPTEENYPGFQELPDYGKIEFPSMKPISLHTLLPDDTAPSAVDLIQKMLQLDPKKRISARDALKHEYFKDVREAMKCDVDAESDGNDKRASYHTELLRSLVHFPEELRLKEEKVEEEERVREKMERKEQKDQRKRKERNERIEKNEHESNSAAASSVHAAAPSPSQPASASTSSSTSLISPASQHYSTQLLSMHLSSTEWNPSSCDALMRQNHLQQHASGQRKVPDFRRAWRMGDEQGT